MPSSAVAGMVFLLSQELFQMVKPMTEIELNEKIENLLPESAPSAVIQANWLCVSKRNAHPQE